MKNACVAILLPCVIPMPHQSLGLRSGRKGQFLRLYSYAPMVSDDVNAVKRDLPTTLSHFSEVGSKDDMSLAIIVNNKTKKQ